MIFGEPQPGKEYWYRITDYRTAGGVDEWGDIIPGSGSSHLRLEMYEVVKHTPKGVWIYLGWEGKRFVLRDARKRFACPTKEEALESFMARKRRQIRILTAQRKNAKEALRLAEGEEGKKLCVS